MKNISRLGILFFMSIIFMFVPEALGQQRVYPVTIVNGVVTDSVTNEPLEYVNIYLKGSDKGCMTDEYGRFSISTDANFTSLQATLMGYDVKEIFVDKGRENMLRLQLSPTSVTLQEVTVNATKNKYSKKNNPAVELMERIRSHKRYSDPRRNDYYSYDKYEKTVLALILARSPANPYCLYRLRKKAVRCCIGKIQVPIRR